MLFGLDRDTAIISAVVICVVATAYLYRELKKSKEEISQVKNFIEREVEESQAYMNAAAASNMMPPPETPAQKIEVMDEEPSMVPEKRITRSSEMIQPQ
tara:strand:- start:62 stop:358 length:297 start_codon:yes stop_codon:yes gene_type:complete